MEIWSLPDVSNMVTCNYQILKMWLVQLQNTFLAHFFPVTGDSSFWDNFQVEGDRGRDGMTVPELPLVQ